MWRNLFGSQTSHARCIAVRGKTTCSVSGSQHSLSWGQGIEDVAGRKEERASQLIFLFQDRLDQFQPGTLQLPQGQGMVSAWELISHDAADVWGKVSHFPPFPSQLHNRPSQGQNNTAFITRWGTCVWQKGPTVYMNKQVFL